MPKKCHVSDSDSRNDHVARISGATAEVTTTSAPVTVAETARNLGVEFDNELALSAQVNAVCRSNYYHLQYVNCAPSHDI